MTPRTLLDFLADHPEDVERALRFHRHLEHRDDLLAELWLVHHDLSRIAGRQLDITHPLDRQALLDGWRRRLKLDAGREKRRADRTRSAYAPLNADAPGFRLIDVLPADDASDPLEALDRLEAERAHLLVPAEVVGTWSQPAGYLLLYEQVGERMHELTALCGTRDSALLARLKRLVDVHRVQSRLFDGLQRLDARDVAPPSVRLHHVRAHGDAPAQAALWAHAATDA